MIDLNYKKKKEAEETPLGIVILGCLPFAFGFWWMLVQGILHG